MLLAEREFVFRFNLEYPLCKHNRVGGGVIVCGEEEEQQPLLLIYMTMRPDHDKQYSIWLTMLSR